MLFVPTIQQRQTTEENKNHLFSSTIGLLLPNMSLDTNNN